MPGRAIFRCSLPCRLGGGLDRFERLTDAEAAGLLARREFLEGLQELADDPLRGQERPSPCADIHSMYIMDSVG